MIIFKNVRRLSGKREDLKFESTFEKSIDGSHLTALPALIDPHVHFRAPGDEHKEDWKTAAKAALQSGVTYVNDMPNNRPSCTTIERILEKKKIIDAQLKEVDIPLRYGLYLGAEKGHLHEISKAAGLVAGVKVFMGGSTGDLLLDDPQDFDEVCKRAKESGLVVAVHAEDEKMLQERKKQYADRSDAAAHSIIRSTELAVVAVKRALESAAKYGTTLYLLHISSRAELDVIRQAKKSGMKVFAEATPHHLFLTTDDYATLGTRVQTNPPLRSKEDQKSLWEALVDCTIDTIGTDHAPHLLEEKALGYPKAPSGIPGIDTSLSLMLNAVHEKRLTLGRLIELMHDNPCKLFNLSENNDLVLVDLEKKWVLGAEDLRTKCGWSPYLGRNLTGCPLYTILGGRVFNLARAEQ
jgi:dihydroorotase